MRFEFFFSEIADEQMDILESSKDKKAICNTVKKTLRFMETNLKHPSLNTHAYESITGPNNAKVFESYAQNNTPGAYRVFWYYGPNRGNSTVLAIIPHP